METRELLLAVQRRETVTSQSIIIEKKWLKLVVQCVPEGIGVQILSPLRLPR
jgi:hypothetical protein